MGNRAMLELLRANAGGGRGIMRKGDGSGAPGPGHAARAAGHLAHSSGQPLSQSVRGYVEPRFGRDFSDVRVHTGSAAASAARAVHARAFTLGNDVVFGAGEYQPESSAGRLLLAHELAHVCQGSTSPRAASDGSWGVADSAPHEHEADSIARVVADGGSVRDWSPQPAAGGAQRWSLRGIVGDIIDTGGDIIEGGLDIAGDVVEGAADLGGDIIEGGLDIAGDVVEGAVDLGGDIVEGGLDLGGDIVSGGLGIASDLTGIDTLRDIGDTVDEGLDDAGGFVNDTADAVGGFANRGLDWAGGTADRALDSAGGMANRGLDWLGETADDAADVMADVVRYGVTFSLPDIPLCPRLSHTFGLGKYGTDLPLLAGAMPLGGPVFLTGSLGLFLEAAPSLQLALGPCRLTEIRVTIDPLGRSSATARLSIGAGAALSLMLKGGARGEVGLVVVVPIGGVPVPVPIPGAQLDLGGFGFGQASAIGEISIRPEVGFELLGGIDVSFDTAFSLGGALDLWAGVFGSIEALGQHLCTLMFPLVDYHADGAMRIDFSLSSGSLGMGMMPTGLSVSRIPFADIETALKRKPPASSCPITDFACEWLRRLGLLPSQNGGSWSWGGPYGPGRRLAGPLDVYERDPGIASGALCRGACGPDCDTCESRPTYRYVDPGSGESWKYRNFKICNTHDGCRQHDAGFDWAAAEHGETGSGIGTMLKPWHMAANIECTCSNDPAQCIGWIMGRPPHDPEPLYFADEASRGGSEDGGADDCQRENPGALDCHPFDADRQLVLEYWGSQFGFQDFRDFSQRHSFPPGDHVACETASGSLWTGLATDVLMHQTVPIGIYQCLCCESSSATGSNWRGTHLISFANLPEEFLLSLCDRGLLPDFLCQELYRRVRERYGNEHRNPDLNPDEDVHVGGRRLDDPPYIDDFRRMYNRLDSWNIYIDHHHPDWYAEFDGLFHVNTRRGEWLAELKERTSEYKRSFRDLSTYDAQRLENEFIANVLREIQGRIEDLNREIALWYLHKTGSNEDPSALIERIHLAGTELWRERWLAAILGVNRVLSRLWPPAKQRIEAFVAIQRRAHPGVDLSGAVGDISYIGSTARGYKGPPKQYIRFNTEKFDVDANLDAPPLAKYAVRVRNLVPDRERIFGRNTDIAPLNQFSDQAHQELSQDVEGYNTGDPFDVAITAEPLDVQRRQTKATERIYALRARPLPEILYRQMIQTLDSEGFLTQVDGGPAVRGDLTQAEFERVNTILDSYEAMGP